MASASKSSGGRPLPSQEDIYQDIYVYPMAVVERFTGLTRRRIRYYEQVGLVHPSRTGGGHRLYSPENVDTLLRIKALVECGIATMEAVRRMMAAGFDRRDPLEAKDSTRRWALQPENMGDAAMRVMRPMDIPNSRPSAVPETDSPSYFRRFTVLPKA